MLILEFQSHFLIIVRIDVKYMAQACVIIPLLIVTPCLTTAIIGLHIAPYTKDFQYIQCRGVKCEKN